MRTVTRIVICTVLAALLAACTRGPDATRIEQDVQARVDALFGRQVLALESFRRQGSAPYRAADDGARQVIVYFNATFRVAEAYDPSDWQGLSPTTIANTVGASDDGITGLRAGRNEPGTLLRAYGSVIYRKSGDVWQPADVVAPRPPPAGVEESAAKTRADELVRRLSDVVQKPPGRRGTEDAIIAEELARALANIQLRLDVSGEKVVVASGPPGGEYERFLEALTGRVRRVGPISVAQTAGSVENASLLERDEARFALIQSDVAAAAVTGDGVFSGTGPLGHLRALASLFPEPLHVVVRTDSGIHSLHDLAGRRVALGGVASGTRQTALKLLEVAGVEPGSIHGLEEPSPQAALAHLMSGDVDAVIEVVSAPWRQLEIAMRSEHLELLSLDAATIVQISADVHGLVPLDIPARTYPGQSAVIRTVAATALLVARDDVPDALVRDTLELMYATAASGGAGVQATRLSRQRALEGITIPLHPAAVHFFSATPRGEAQQADAPATATGQVE